MTDKLTPASSSEVSSDDQPEAAVSVTSLKGTMTAVLVMGIFFVSCWVGVWMLYVHRR